MSENMLDLKNITKWYGGVQALNKVDFAVKKSEIHCLVGENGSGKSTLIKIISGVVQPEAGAEIIVEGEKIKKMNSELSLNKGIQVIYQDLSLFPNLTVAENIAVYLHQRKGVGIVNWKQINSIAENALKKIDINFDLEKKVSSLSIADRQLVAITRALALDAKIIIMDEPTASLANHEVSQLFKIIRDMQNRGITTIFVSHKLDEIMEISEKVTILRDGNKVGTYPAQELNNKRISYLMSGEEIDYSNKLNKIQEKEKLLEVKDLSKKGKFKNISFNLKKGEILGITGLLGSGRSEVALSIFGMEAADSGKILVEGSEVKINNTDDALFNNISYVPEDRLTQGLIMNQSVADNLILTMLDHLSNKYNLLDKEKKNNFVEKWVEELNIKIPSKESSMDTLSGGNQQKAVLAKWIATDPKILILDGPTVGVDVAAKNSIYNIIHDLAAKGIGVIIISDEVPEIIYNTNRILVMRSGQITGEYYPQNISEKELTNIINEK
ncbi:MAG: sugar ABC transporter ATP-binding protein [Bacillota bacterium]